MYLRLDDAVEFEQVYPEEEPERILYRATTRKNKRIIMSENLFHVLESADGTHALPFSKSMQKCMEKDGVLTRSRWIKDGWIRYFILLAVGEKKSKALKPWFRLPAKLLPYVSLVTTVLGTVLFLMEKPQIWAFEVNIPLVIALIVLSLVFHECGHFMVGIANSYSMTNVGVLCLCVFPIGGYVMPEDREDETKTGKIRMVAAGVEMNLFLLGLSLLLSTLQTPYTSTLLAFAYMEVLIIVENLIPVEGRDGSLILSSLLGVENVNAVARCYFKDRKKIRALLRKPGGVFTFVCLCYAHLSGILLIVTLVLLECIAV